MKISNMTCENLVSPHSIDCASPRFSFCLESDTYNLVITGYRIIVSQSEEAVSRNRGDMWDSGIINSSLSQQIQYKGKPLQSKKTYYWKVFTLCNTCLQIDSATERFGMGLLDVADWRCGFIGISSNAMQEVSPFPDLGLPAPYFRKLFFANKPIKNAKVFATAYGVYELYLNGERVGEDRLTPSWTDYNKTILYHCFELSDKIRTGSNVIGAILGDGWYTGNVAIAGRKQYGDYPLGVMVHLHLEYQDGQTETVVTDTSWKGTYGAYLCTDLQNGEVYDATKEQDGWCSADFDDSGWMDTVPVKKNLKHQIKASASPGIRVNEKLSPVSITKNKDNKIIVDMGQNMVGFVRVKLYGQKHQNVVFRHGEMLYSDGSLYTGNLRSALQTDIYICKGEEEGEVFEPHFTFHGFRYVEISGLTYVPTQEDIAGMVLYSSCQRSGYIETGNDLVNQLFSNLLWGQKGNFVGLPTDCPQRDERMGWTADAQIFAKTACYNMQCAAFYERYINDCIDAQKSNGNITDVAPIVVKDSYDLVGNGNAGWGDAIFIIPWTLYEMYGDECVLKNTYDSMMRYFDYLMSTTEGYLRPDSGYGDWLNIDAETPKDVLSTAYFAYDALLLYKISLALGKSENVNLYRNYFEEIKKAFQEAYVDNDMRIKGDTQCCYLLALKMELAEKEQIDKMSLHLLRTIHERDYHLSTGFIGVSYLLPILCDCGYSEIAYKILLNVTYPSWGYSIKNGATTIWERWNSFTLEQGFGDETMNSFNHYSLGSVGEWMYTHMAGITPLLPGFKKIRIKPYIDMRIGFVKAAYRSVYGEIVSSWEVTDGECIVCVQIPANTSAEIILPSGAVQVCDPSSAALSAVDRETCIVVNSGIHRFSFTYNNIFNNDTYMKQKSVVFVQ